MCDLFRKEIKMTNSPHMGNCFTFTINHERQPEMSVSREVLGWMEVQIQCGDHVQSSVLSLANEKVDVEVECLFLNVTYGRDGLWSFLGNEVEKCNIACACWCCQG